MVENNAVKSFEMRRDVFKAGLKEAGCAEANTGWRLEQKASAGSLCDGCANSRTE